MIRMVITVCLFVSSRTPRPTLCKFLLFFFFFHFVIQYILTFLVRLTWLWTDFFADHTSSQKWDDRHHLSVTWPASQKTTLEWTQTCGCCAEDSRGTEGNNPGASKLGERSRWQQQNDWQFSGGDKLCEEIVDKNNHNIFYKAWRNGNVGWNYTVIYTEEKEWRGTAEFTKAARTLDDVTAIIISLFLPLTMIGSAHYGVNSYLSKTLLEGDVWNCFGCFSLLSLSLRLSQPHLKV